MGVGRATLTDLPRLSTDRSTELLPTERLLWILAILLFAIGDIITTTIGQNLGLYEVNPIFRSLFAHFPVPLVMTLGMGLQVGLAILIALRLTTPLRVAIPVVLAVIGMHVVHSNVLAILTVL